MGSINSISSTITITEPDPPSTTQYSFTSNGANNVLVRNEFVYTQSGDIILEFEIEGAPSGDRRFYCESDITGSTQIPVYALGSGSTDFSKLKVFIRDSLNNPLVNTESSTTIFDGAKHTLLYKDIAGVITIEVDGGVPEAIATYTRKTDAEMGFTGSSMFAIYRGGGSSWFDGTLHNAILGPRAFDFNEGTGNIVDDDIGTSFTIQGTVLESQWKEEGGAEPEPPVVEDLFYVDDYGAVGDGSTDDTAPIQSAIDAAYANGGGVVSLSAKTYKTTSRLWMRTNVTLRGQGNSSVIYPYARFKWTSPLWFQVGAHDVNLENFKIWTDYAHSEEDFYGLVGWDGSACYNVVVDNVTFDAQFMNRNSFYVKSKDGTETYHDITIKNCTFENAGRMNVEIFGTAGAWVNGYNIYIQDNVFKDSGNYADETYAISTVSGLHNVNILRNTFNSTASSVYVEIGGPMDLVNIHDNDFGGQANENKFFIYNTSSNSNSSDKWPINVDIRGNNTINGAKRKISFRGTRSLEMTNNTMSLYWDGVGGAAMELEYGCNNANIHNNNLTFDGYVGIACSGVGNQINSNSMDVADVPSSIVYFKSQDGFYAHDNEFKNNTIDNDTSSNGVRNGSGTYNNTVSGNVYI